MKTAHENKTIKKEALSLLLKNVRDTPQQATGIAPDAMVFRDGYCATFLRKSVKSKQVKDAQVRDLVQKEQSQEKITSSKFRQETQILVEDTVLLRNLQITEDIQTTLK